MSGPVKLEWRAMVMYRGRKKRARAVRENSILLGNFARTDHVGGEPLAAMVAAAEAALLGDAAEILSARLVLYPVSVENHGSYSTETMRMYDPDRRDIVLRGPG